MTLPEILVTGRCPRIARVHDEEWHDPWPRDHLNDLVAAARAHAPRPDLFTFGDTWDDDLARRHPFFTERDNASVIPLTSHQEWWEQRLSQDSRRNVRLAAKRGVEVRAAQFNEEFVRGIKSIYDEAAIRQGRRFPHYMKPLAQVRAENSTYSERSHFRGAYLGPRLIGFLKIVLVGPAGRIMQILSSNAELDKKPMNALIAGAVELCCQQQLRYLVYCKHVYGRKTNSSITEFKRRMGFEQKTFPRYWVPLTSWGRLLLSLSLHKPVRESLPEWVMTPLLRARAAYYQHEPRNLRMPRQRALQS